MNSQNYIYAGNPNTKDCPWKWILNTDESRNNAITQGYTAFTTMSFAFEPVSNKDEPMRHGDLWIDFDSKNDPKEAIVAARTFVKEKLMYRYGVNLSSLHYFLSGGKGAHLMIPAVIFGGENGHPYLPLIYRRMISLLCRMNKAQMEKSHLDTSLYCMGKGKLLRAPNILRPDGRYKIPVPCMEFMEMDMDALISLTSTPRCDFDPMIRPPEPSNMSVLYEAASNIQTLLLSRYNAKKGIQSLLDCEFIQHCYCKQESLSEKEWWMMICLFMKFGEEARSIVHEFSMGHADYTHAKTEDKIRFALERRYNISCKTIKEHFQCGKVCPLQTPTDGWLKTQSDRVVASASFSSREDGVYYTPQASDEAPLWVCSPMRVLGKVRNADSTGWARLVEITTPDGKLKQVHIPMRDCAGRGDAVRSLLLDNGLEIPSGGKIGGLLMDYLRLGGPENEILLCIEQVGWHDGIYVLPDTRFGGDFSENVYFQGQVDNLHNVSGTLDQWQAHVGKLCASNSLLVFATSYALTGPLLRLCTLEGGGLHIWGGSSSGKTTLALVAGSLCGGGGNLGFARQWRSTHNALESTAAMHNDNLLILDEVGQATSEVVSQVSYMLANGQGKDRLRSDATRRKTYQWQVNFLSTGELGIGDKIEESGKHRSMVGQEVRNLDLPADRGSGKNLFDNLHGFASPAELSQHLKWMALQYYGTPLRAFLTALCGENTAARDENVRRVKNLIDSFVQEHCPQKVSGQVVRVARKFGLIAAAGELAIVFGVLPYAPGEARSAAVLCFNVWLQQRNGLGDLEMEKALRRIVDHFAIHSENRYENLNNGGYPLAQLEGYRWAQEGKTHLLVLAPIFNGLARGANRQTLVAEMDRRGWLAHTANGKLMETKSVHGENKRGIVFIPSAWEGTPEDVSAKPSLPHASEGEIY